MALFSQSVYHLPAPVRLLCGDGAVLPRLRRRACLLFSPAWHVAGGPVPQYGGGHTFPCSLPVLALPGDPMGVDRGGERGSALACPDTSHCAFWSCTLWRREKFTMVSFYASCAGDPIDGSSFGLSFFCFFLRPLPFCCNIGLKIKYDTFCRN